MGMYADVLPTSHSHPPRMTTFNSHAQEQHSKLYFACNLHWLNYELYICVAACYSSDYLHCLHAESVVQYVLIWDPSFEAKPPKDFTQTCKRKDYRVRILHSRPFIKMRDRYRIQLTMHRCCVDNIVSKKCRISRLRFLSKVILNDVEFNHEH